MTRLGSHRVFYLILGLLAVAIVSVQVGAYYYFQRSYDGTSSKSSVLCSSLTTSNSPGTDVVSVNTLVNYGNGTTKWYNETNIPSGWNFYQLTLYLVGCNVQAQSYGPPLNEHLVTGINGVIKQGTYSWTLWEFCQKHSAWVFSPVGVDLIHVENGQTLAWVYEVSSSVSSSQPPVAGARTVSSCS